MSEKPLFAVVDDDDAVRDALVSLMRSLNYRVVAFPSGVDFLNAPERPNVDCVIADVQMPGMTGLELHHRLVVTGLAIPTILITAYPDDTMRQRALRAGVKCYLAKPFREEELLDCINSVLGARSDTLEPGAKSRPHRGRVKP